MSHLDNKAKGSCDLKQGILDTLSQCVIVAADGSLGEASLSVDMSQNKCYLMCRTISA